MADILLVEDDESDVISFNRACRKVGLNSQVIVARDGAAALRILGERSEGQIRRESFIVVTDLNMPGMSGHDLIAKMRADPSLRSSVVFVMTTSELSRDIKLAYERNVAGYLVKREDSSQMREAVNMLKSYATSVVLPQFCAAD